MSQVIAVILAGGSGSRTGLSKPKQFLEVCGKTVLEHSVDAFHRHQGIDRIAIVISSDYRESVEQMVRSNGWTKVTHILQGGRERYDSSLSAVRAFSNDPDCIMLFHDAARPLVTQKIISDSIKAMQEYDCIDVAIPSADTIVQCTADGHEMVSVADRRLLWRMQTPQGFRQRTIQEAYRIALQDPEFTATDDCGTVLKYLPDTKVGIVPGDNNNIKLTYPEDIPLIRFLMQERKD